MTTTKVFIFEGIDSCGKDTIINKLYLDLRDRYKISIIPSVTVSRIGENIRLLLMGKNVGHKQMVALFIADYYNKIKLINQAIEEEHDMVLCNRWITTTMAYAKDVALLPAIDRLSNKDVLADVLYYIDITATESRDRRRKMRKSIDMYSDMKTVQEARENYKIILKDNKWSKELVEIDGMESKEDVYGTILTDIVGRLK